MDCAVDHSLETVCNTSHDHVGVDSHEAIASPLLTANDALEQKAARTVSERGLRQHRREAISDDLAIHRNHRRRSAEALELFGAWKILAHRTRITPTPWLAKLPGAKAPVEKTWRTYP